MTEYRSTLQRAHEPASTNARKLVTTRPLNDEGAEPWGRLELAIAGTSHVGRVRATNQDAFDRFDDPDRGEILLVVADGLGGHRGGETASKMAVGTLGKLWNDGDSAPATRLVKAIERANSEIHKLGARDRTLKGMGTTIVVLLLCKEGASFVAHVGDSRLYRSRREGFETLTEDHSVVALLVRDGAISPEEARSHPKRNQIMRALGVGEDVEVEVSEVDVQPGDAYILCSDGLYGMLPDEDLQTLTQRAPDPHAAVAWMIDAANQAGGTDNVTALVAQIRDPENRNE